MLVLAWSTFRKVSILWIIIGVLAPPSIRVDVCIMCGVAVCCLKRLAQDGTRQMFHGRPFFHICGACPSGHRYADNDDRLSGSSFLIACVVWHRPLLRASVLLMITHSGGVKPHPQAWVWPPSLVVGPYSSEGV